MGDRDFYPDSMDARAAWHGNYAKTAPDFAAKYGLDAATLAAIAADNAWMQYWVAARHSAEAQSQQLTRFFNTIAGTNVSAEAPAAIDWELATPVPTQVPPGIKQRVLDQARFIKNNMDYAEADGILMGIQLPPQEGAAEIPDPPVIELVTMPEFKLQAKFRKRGMDGVRFEYRLSGDVKWITAGFLMVSPGTFSIPPANPAEGQQVEIRAIYFKGNSDVGNFSPIYTAFIAP